MSHTILRATLCLLTILITLAPAQARAAEGALAPEHIRATVRAHTDEVRACYEAALVEAPTLEGALTVRFTIEASGAVAAAEVEASTLSDARVERCVLSAVRGWTFPAPVDGPLIVRYPFTFTPAP